MQGRDSQVIEMSREVSNLSVRLKDEARLQRAYSVCVPIPGATLRSAPGYVDFGLQPKQTVRPAVFRPGVCSPRWPTRVLKPMKRGRSCPASAEHGSASRQSGSMAAAVQEKKQPGIPNLPVVNFRRLLSHCTADGEKHPRPHPLVLPKSNQPVGKKPFLRSARHILMAAMSAPIRAAGHIQPLKMACPCATMCAADCGN